MKTVDLIANEKKHATTDCIAVKTFRRNQMIQFNAIKLLKVVG